MTFQLSRRRLLGTGGVGLAGAALAAAAPGARANAGSPSGSEALVRAWYQLWLTRTDWAPFDAMLADDFAFSSTNGEDRIDKDAYKAHVWAPNIGRIASFDPVLVMAKDDAVFVKFFGHTKSGNTFLNVELHRLRDDKIVSIECYFGSQMAFPAAVDSK